VTSIDGSSIVNIGVALAGQFSSYDLSKAGMSLIELVLLPADDIVNASIRVERISDPLCAPLTGERIIEPYNVTSTGLEGKVKSIIFKFKVDKRIFTELNLDPKNVTIVFSKCSIPLWNDMPTYLVKEDLQYYYYIAISPSLSVYAIKVQPLVCQCPAPSDWSLCMNGIRSRLFYDCGQHTGNACVSQVESRACDEEVPHPTGLPIETIVVVPIIGLAVGGYIFYIRGHPKGI